MNTDEDFRPGKLTVEEYKARQERHTTEQLERLLQSPEFRRLAQIKRLRAAVRLTAGLLVAALLLFSAGLALCKTEHETSRLQAWQPHLHRVELLVASAKDRTAAAVLSYMPVVLSYVRPANSPADAQDEAASKPSHQAEALAANVTASSEPAAVSTSTAAEPPLEMSAQALEPPELEGSSVLSAAQAHADASHAAEVQELRLQLEAALYSSTILQAGKEQAEVERENVVLFSWYSYAGMLLLLLLVCGRLWRLLVQAKEQLREVESRSASREATYAREAREAKAKATQLETRLSAKLQEAKDANASALSWQKECSDLRNKLGEMTQQAAEAAGEAWGLRELHAKLDAECAELRKERNSLASKSDSLQRQVDKAGKPSKSMQQDPPPPGLEASSTLNSDQENQIPNDSQASRESVLNFSSVPFDSASISSRPTSRTNEVGKAQTDQTERIKLLQAEVEDLQMRLQQVSVISAQEKTVLQQNLEQQLVQVTWLSEQNSTLEDQLEQVTNSLREFVHKKATVDHLTLSQTQDLNDMAILLIRKEEERSFLESELEGLRHTVAKALKWLRAQQAPPLQTVEQLEQHLLNLQAEEVSGHRLHVMESPA